ncbi:carboxymuconolactone decarboxylase family protein [Membranihabitans maritimus]|uniref:carboxymuconolactone decarboxylase family protein n=1 Tax=Membranihabitans maritimus TaxID=2904244 RepID=UPI001F3EB8CD|nr:carboxymuconolactone decarboxylase family protein [Membranihabitans maritimus]
MTYINTGINQPGIVELLFYKGPTGKALSNLAHTLLHGPSNLSQGERELIASYVSKLNKCEFCHESHSASANVHFNDNGNTINCVITDLATAPVSDKMKALLAIASKVQKSGREVTEDDIITAKNGGALDEDIHDTILIASAFCMFNRYVDGLGTNLPLNKKEYEPMGIRLAKKGYKYPPLFLRKFVIKMMNRKNRD